MDEEKVVLDRKSFEALAVETRVRILKSLKQRRKTLSEISAEMKMSVSGVKEHLETLEGAGLIKKMDDGHKWKYYELTKKGSELVAPKELRVWVVLSMAMIGLVISMLAMLPSASLQGESLSAAGAPLVQDTFSNSGAEPAPMLAKTANAENGSDRGMNAAEGHAEPLPCGTTGYETMPAGFDRQLPFFVAGISVLTMLACLGILALNRIRR
jgi:DNA-binding transcriptional ArsR family regulator